MSINIEKLSCSLRGVEILTEVSCIVESGSLVSVVGANGAGKSTLLRCLLGLHSFSGRVLYQNQSSSLDPRKCSKIDLAKEVAWVPQIASMDLGITVVDYLRRSRYARTLVNEGKEKKADAAIVQSALERIGISSLKNRRLSELSGGEKRLVLLSAALVQESRVILVDEPAACLDIANRGAMFRVISSLNQQLGITVILVTHEINEAARISDRFIALKEGRVCFEGLPEEFLVSDFLGSTYSADFELVRVPGQRYPLVTVP